MPATKTPSLPVREIDLTRWIEACQAVGVTGVRALKLYRNLGGRIRTQEFIRAWHLAEERRGAWEGIR